ncbi:MAG: DHHA1 domain-containing protein [Candidatus Nanoarchaeia archaeon]
MLTNEEISQVREHLEKAQNPLFFFDNDNDGLMSYFILRRHIGRGKGVAIKSFPDLNSSYYRKVEELKPDYIFVLDKPAVSKDFLEKAHENNIPVVWIDHHIVEKPSDMLVYYYNAYKGEEAREKEDAPSDNALIEPVSYISYKVTNNKRDIWLAIIGCISDCYLPNFYPEFEKEYPELAKKNPKNAFDVLYNSEIGRITRIIDYSLKDTTTNVINMMKFMLSVKTPIDIIQENSRTKQMLKRYEQINQKYEQLIKKAKSFAKEKFLYFQYGGELSLSSGIANQLIFEFPEKIIIVVYLRGDIANISIRGKGDIRKLTLESIKNIEGALGGGHKSATGAKLNVSDLPVFKDNIIGLINSRK